MWKLTITQKKELEHVEGTYDVELEFYNKNIHKLFDVVDSLSNIESVRETTYSIEKVKESEA